MKYAVTAGHGGNLYLTMATAMSAFFGIAAWRLRGATPAAAACGALTCFDITVLSGRPEGGSIFHSGLPPLILLFILAHAATRFRRDRKQTVAAENNEKHGRNSAQVIANLGVAAVASLRYFWIFRAPGRPQIDTMAVAYLQIPMRAALAEATADTVSSAWRSSRPSRSITGPSQSAI